MPTCMNNGYLNKMKRLGNGTKRKNVLIAKTNLQIPNKFLFESLMGGLETRFKLQHTNATVGKRENT